MTAAPAGGGDRAFGKTGEPGAGVHEVSLTVPAGTSLGLVGPSGSGKSTLAHLVPRLHDPTHGRVELGGVDLRTVLPASLRQRVAVVDQQVQILPASLRDNLTVFVDCADDRLVEIMTELGLGTWFARQPEGLDTQLAQSRLSGGEAQLVSLCRVFLHDPSVVVLDEPSQPAGQGRREASPRGHPSVATRPNRDRHRSRGRDPARDGPGSGARQRPRDPRRAVRQRCCFMTCSPGAAQTRTS